MSAPETPAPFVPYEVPGIGTVEAHEGATYVVRVASGSVYGYASPSGTPSEVLAADEIAHAIAHPPTLPAAPRSQSTRVILDRLTPAEAAALTGSTHAAIKLLVLKATAAGSIREDDPDFPTARAGLDALGIIAAARWDALFAP
jgi:hypothetical protein